MLLPKGVCTICEDMIVSKCGQACMLLGSNNLVQQLCINDSKRDLATWLDFDWVPLRDPM